MKLRCNDRVLCIIVVPTLNSTDIMTVSEAKNFKGNLNPT